MGILYVVPTPIGNLEDITFRALNTLKEVDLILAEDTRTSGKLMKHFEIDTPMRSYHMHNEHKIVKELVEKIQTSEHGFALISDAGTPAISDPGYLLVKECIENDVEVITLPGPTAFVPALVNSGLPCDTFYFAGFLPQKKGRQKKWSELIERKETVVVYESPYRVKKFLEEAKGYLGEERRISCSREISKKFEQTIAGTAQELINHFEQQPPKGEFVIVF